MDAPDDTDLDEDTDEDMDTGMDDEPRDAPENTVMYATMRFASGGSRVCYVYNCAVMTMVVDGTVGKDNWGVAAGPGHPCNGLMLASMLSASKAHEVAHLAAYSTRLCH